MKNQIEGRTDLLTIWCFFYFSMHYIFLKSIKLKRSVKSEKSLAFEQWDRLTAKFAGAANIPFLLLQLPQILLNARNLLAGNKTALLAVPWLVFFFSLFFWNL